MSDSLRLHGLYSPWNSPGQDAGVGSCPLLQGTFPSQGLNQGYPHCRRILYQLSHKGSPRILEWVALFLLQWIFLTQKSNWSLLHYRQETFYQLSLYRQVFTFPSKTFHSITSNITLTSSVGFWHLILFEANHSYICTFPGGFDSK